MVTFSNSKYSSQFTFIKSYLKSTFPELDAHITVIHDNEPRRDCQIMISTCACDSVHAGSARQHANSAIGVLRSTYSHARFINAC